MCFDHLDVSSIARRGCFRPVLQGHTEGEVLAHLTRQISAPIESLRASFSMSMFQIAG